MSAHDQDLALLYTRRALNLLDEDALDQLESALESGRAPVLDDLDAELAAAELTVEAPPESVWERIEATLDATPAPAPQPAVHVGLSCTFCRGTLSGDNAVYCSECLAPHHLGCFEEYGRCCASGCSGRDVVTRQRVAAAPPRWRRRLGIGLAVGLVGVGAAAVVELQRDLEARTAASSLPSKEAPKQAPKQAPAGPLYEGRSIDEWLGLLRDRSPGTREGATVALVALAPDSTPALEHAAHSDDLLLAWSSWGALHRLDDARTVPIALARDVLARGPSEEHPEVRHLLRARDDVEANALLLELLPQTPPHEATSVLSHLGETEARWSAAREDLARLLPRLDALSLCEVLRLAVTWRETHFLPALEGMLRDPDTPTRVRVGEQTYVDVYHAVLEAYARLTQPRQRDALSLTIGLRRVQLSSASQELLARLLTELPGAVPVDVQALIERTLDDSSAVRDAAAYALAIRGLAPDAVLRVVIPHPIEDRWASQQLPPILHGLGEHARAALPVLVRTFRTRSVSVHTAPELLRCLLLCQPTWDELLEFVQADAPLLRRAAWIAVRTGPTPPKHVQRTLVDLLLEEFVLVDTPSRDDVLERVRTLSWLLQRRWEVFDDPEVRALLTQRLDHLSAESQTTYLLDVWIAMAPATPYSPLVFERVATQLEASPWNALVLLANLPLSLESRAQLHTRLRTQLDPEDSEIPLRLANLLVATAVEADPPGWELVVRTLRTSQDEQLRALAADALGQSRLPAALSILGDALSDPAYGVQTAALSALAEWPGPVDPTPLLDLFRRASFYGLQREVAEVFLAHDIRAGAELLRRSVDVQRLQQPWSSDYAVLVEALWRLSDDPQERETLEAALAQCRSDRDPEIRWIGARCLGDSEVLIQLSEGVAPAERLALVEDAQRSGATEALEHWAASDPFPAVREAAAAALR